MFAVQCEKTRTNHLTPLLVVTTPYVCWFLWWENYIGDFKWHLHFQFGVVFRKVVLREVYFEGHWRLQSWTMQGRRGYTLIPLRNTQRTFDNCNWTKREVRTGIRRRFIADPLMQHQILRRRDCDNEKKMMKRKNNNKGRKNTNPPK